MRIHFIAIGGAAMHNLAIALKNKNYIVSGSDDIINDPSKSRLMKHGLLPEKYGWNVENISKELGVEFLDASKIVKTNTIDGIHWDVNQHNDFALFIAQYIKSKI